MAWYQTPTGWLNLDRVWVIEISSTWTVSLYLAANVVDSDNNDGQAVFTLGPYDSQADAQATVEEITQLHGGQWVFAGAGFGQYYNAAYIYQLLVSGSGTQWFTQAFINSGVAQSSGFSDGPTLTQYTSESDANNGLAALMQQLSIVNAGD